MTWGPEIEIVIPENLNLTTYYLEENITREWGDKVAVYYQDKRYTAISATSRTGLEMCSRSWAWASKIVYCLSYRIRLSGLLAGMPP